MPVSYAFFHNLISELKSELKSQFNGTLDNHFSVIQFDARAGYEDAAKFDAKPQVMSKGAGA